MTGDVDGRLGSRGVEVTYTQTAKLLRAIAFVCLVYSLLAVAAAWAGSNGELLVITGAERPMMINESAGEEPVVAAVEVANGTGQLRWLVWWGLSGVVAGAGGLAVATGALVLDVQQKRRSDAPRAE